MFDREKLMSQLEDAEEEITIANALDKAEKTLCKHEPVFTNFLNPYQRSLLTPILDQIYDLKYRTYGGFKRAERKRVGLMPDYYMLDLIDNPFVILEINGNFEFENVSHRDFLGAILGTGIKREMIGDLVVNHNNRCQVIVAKEMEEYLTLNLDKVHRVPVEIEKIDPERLDIEPENVKELKSTVASLRLDSVASSGFSTSRTKMAKEIKAGNVKLNWQTETDPAQMVEMDDIISIRGRGRVEIDEKVGRSKKDRIKLILKRFT